MMLMPFFLQGQSIMGVKIGTGYEETEKILKTRFGYNVVNDKGNLSIYDFYMGDFHFKSGKFCFQWEGEISKFTGAEFQTWENASNVEDIKRMRERLKRIIESKYNIFEYKNKQGFLGYEFLGEEVNGITMHGEIDIERMKGRDDVERLYLFLIYYPIADFIQENSDF